MKTTYKIFLCAILSVAFAACTKDKVENGMLSIRLTDAPAVYDEVLIDVQSVLINASGTDENGWTKLDSLTPGVFNLLDFTNGMDTILAEQVLPAGNISQIRLVLGVNNKVKVNGKYFGLETPSAQQSGLKFNVHAEIEAGKTYRMWIDFDAAKSIVATAKGYQLVPVLRTFTQETSAAIEGTVSSADSLVYVHAISQANDTVTTVANRADGYFLIRVMEAGTYRIAAKSAAGAASAEKNVTVALGSTTDAGSIVLK